MIAIIEWKLCPDGLWGLWKWSKALSKDRGSRKADPFSSWLDSSFSLGLNGSSKPVWIFPEIPVWALQAKKGNILAYRFPNPGKRPLTKTCPSPSVALVLLTPSVTENDGVRWITIVNLSTCCYNAGNIRSCQISHPLTLYCIYLHRDVMPKLMNKLLKTQSRMEGLSGRNTVKFRHDLYESGKKLFCSSSFSGQLRIWNKMCRV